MFQENVSPSGIVLSPAPETDENDQESDLRDYTDNVLHTIKQQNDILSPIVNIICDEVENPSSVFPHSSDPPIFDQSLSTSPNQTDRPPDHLELIADYADTQYNVNHATQGVVRSINQTSVGYLIHHDSGANRSVTNNRNLLHSIKPIQQVKIQGANKGSGFLNCTEKGIFNLQCNDGSVIPVPVYLTDDVEGTILSPTDICIYHYDKFTVWQQHSETNSSKGTLKFYSKDSCFEATIDLIMKNGLWYSEQSIFASSPKCEVVKTMTGGAEYELWHQRLCHPGQTVMDSVHISAEGVPNLKSKRHAFFHCDTCAHAKIHKSNRNKSITTKTTSRGERFHMDFGFVRGEEYKKQNKTTKKFITSIDGFNSYLIVVDAHTRFTWIYLTSCKEPPIDIVRNFLDDNGLSKGPRYIRTDQGGELYASKRFHQLVSGKGYTIEPTGSDNSAQNGVAERPNQTFGNMIRALLSNSNLDSRFWSFALRHSVYVKNRLPHSHHQFKVSPFEAYTGRRPDLSNIRVFGAAVRVRKPGRRPTKLSNHTYSGRFLEFVGTDKNIKYYDVKTKRIKIATHVVFDEAHFSSTNKPPGAVALYNAGVAAESNSITSHDDTSVNFVKLSENAVIPNRATDGSAGADLYSAESKTIPPKSLMLFSTDLSIECPPGTYGRIAPRSGLTVKNNITVMAGVIDSDFRGNVKVALYNFGDEELVITQGTKIAQLIFEQIKYPHFKEQKNLTKTKRNENGFGSTDDSANIHIINHNTDTSSLIELCNDMNGPTIKIDLKVKGNHRTLGLIVDDDALIDQVTLFHCQRGTPAARIKKWRSTLRHAKIIDINGQVIRSKDDIIDIISEARTKKQQSVQITFRTTEPIPINPSSGIPSLYHDQLQHITDILETLHTPSDITIQPNGKILLATENSSETFDSFTDIQDSPYQLFPPHHIFQAIVRHVKAANDSSKSIKKKKKLTRRYLKTLTDWNKWQQAEITQLDLYNKQNMFQTPVPRPKGANILNLLWAYKIKDDGTFKARCVCNGNPRRKGTVTLDHTYAACLEQPGARIFWALAAVEGLIVVGADASNAFAEAPAPKAPLFVEVDDQYREWWMKQGNKPIPRGHVLPVNHALQGHPESPRLWSKLIDSIIRKHVGLQPTTHEPCLYSGDIDGERVYLLRQVDDFAVASTNTSTSNKVIAKISEKLSVPMHNLGILKRFNGVDIHQGQDYIKLSNETYINKVLSNYKWLEKDSKPNKFPVPMKDDSAYMARLDTEKGPDPSENKEKYIALEEQMGFKYRRALGELLFCMVTCRPDISFSVIKLAKYANAPAEIHYTAIKHVLRYLRATINHGIHYWRQSTLHEDLLPKLPLPSLFHIENEQLHQLPRELLGFMDADWAQDQASRKSITGITMMFGGATVYYKTRYQATVAQSSTESEFMSACDAGKISLYLRSILDELHINQENATLLYEDNKGALLMANAQMPTRRTRHMEIKYFSLQDWIEEDLILLHTVESSKNIADTFTKQLGRNLFHKHNDTVMGRRFPTYYKGNLRNDIPVNNSDFSLSKNPRFQEPGEGVL